MKIAITGAAGWLGRYVTAALESSHDLVLIDRVAPEDATIFDPKAPGGRRAVPLMVSWPYHQLDVNDELGVTAALDGVEVIIHLAAWPTGVWDLARSTMATNVMGTFNIFECARACGVRRIVNASSINAFGSFFWRVTGHPPVRRALPIVEDEPTIPEDPYSLSKVVTESIGATYTRAFGMEVANLRFAGVMAETVYQQLSESGLPRTEVWDDHLFQWVHVLDVTQGITRAATVPAVVPVPVTIGAGDTRAPESTLELLTRFHPQLVPLIREPLAGRASLLSIARARSYLGYEPLYSFAEAPGSAG